MEVNLSGVAFDLAPPDMVKGMSEIKTAGNGRTFHGRLTKDEAVTLRNEYARQIIAGGNNPGHGALRRVLQRMNEDLRRLRWW